MNIYTYCTRIKSFVVALSLMLSALFILKFARLDVPSKTNVKDGDSVVALKNIYSTFAKVNFSEMKVFQLRMGNQKISENKEAAFISVHK